MTIRDTARRRSTRRPGTGRAVELRLADTEVTRFGIVAELKADGYAHYLCLPIALMNGGHGWVTFATKQVPGFSVPEVAALARLLPAIAMLVDLRSTWLSLDKLLRTYVGDEPHRAILRGNTKRGQVSTIRSAILFADMRDSIGHTADLGAVEAVQVFNALFDCLVPPIEGRRGEVLKYMGDGAAGDLSRRGRRRRRRPARWRPGRKRSKPCRLATCSIPTKRRSKPAWRSTTARPPTAMSGRASGSTSR